MITSNPSLADTETSESLFIDQYRSIKSVDPHPSQIFLTSWKNHERFQIIILSQILYFF